MEIKYFLWESMEKKLSTFFVLLQHSANGSVKKSKQEATPVYEKNAVNGVCLQKVQNNSMNKHSIKRLNRKVNGKRPFIEEQHSFRHKFVNKEVK